MLIRQQRLMKELNFVEEKQQFVINFEYKNIANLKEQELLDLTPFVNVAFEQIAFSSFIDDWFTTSLASFDVDEIVETFVGNSSNS